MGWRNVGDIGFDEDGVPKVIPYDDSILGTPVLGPIRKRVLPALNAFLFDSFCDISRAMESGYRAAGALSLASGQLAARNSAGCRGQNPGPATVTVDETFLAFLGGQCEGVEYQVSGTFSGDANGFPGGPEFRSIRGIGPVSSIRKIENQFVTAIQVVFSTGPINIVQLGGGPGQPIFVSELAVERTDGLPDDCGSIGQPVELPPPDGLPVPPSPGDVIYAPTWVDIPIDDRDSTSYQFSVNIGAVVFGGITGANVTVGDIPVRILPDLTVQVGDSDEDGGSGNPALPPADDSSALTRIAEEIDQFDQRLLTQLEDIERDLEAIPEVLNLLFPQIEAESALIDCDGEELVFSSSGRGLEGLSSQLSMTAELLARAALFSCPVDSTPPLGPLEVLTTGVASGPVEFVSVPLSEPYAQVILVVSPGEHSRIYRALGDASTGYFGYWGHGPILDGEPVAIEWRQINTYRSAYDIPGRPGWSVWLNLERGVEYTLYGQKLEE